MASISVSGKPGGGKTFYVVSQVILKTLLETDKAVITNVPLNMTAIKHYCRYKGRDDIDPWARILELRDENLGEFWRYRGPGIEPLPAVSEEDGKNGKFPDFEKLIKDNGVVYVLDEFHEKFNSRAWRSTGAGALYYIGKHRHLGDDVYWITHAVSNVDSQWRDRTQEYLYCTNQGKERLKGFTKGKGFTVRSYLQPYTGNQPEQWTKRYLLDKRRAACYSTSIFNKQADKGVFVKGIPIWWAFIGIFAGLAAINYGIDYVLGAGKLKDKAKASEQQHATLPPQPGTVGIVGNAVKTQPVPPQGAPLETPNLAMNIIAVPLRYSPAAEVIATVKPSLPTGPQAIQVVPNGSNDAVVLASTDMQALTAFAEIVRQYDVRSAIVTVRCVVARNVDGRQSDTGLFNALADMDTVGSGVIGRLVDSLVYDLPTGVVTLGGSFGAREAFNLITQFVASDSRFRLMSQPVLSVVSGRKATFTSGREIPVPNAVVNQGTSQSSVQYKNADFTLEVTPTVNTDGSVRIDVAQKNAEVLDYVKIDKNDVPTLTVQSLTTTVDLKGNQLFYLGGINITTAKDSNKGTPGLRKIPLVNWVFGRDSKTTETNEMFVILSVEVRLNGEVPEMVKRPLTVSRPANTQAESKKKTKKER